MNVSVCIATRGDVDMSPITESFPPGWEVLVYDNGRGVCRTYSGRKWGVVGSELPDRGPNARFAAIEYARHDLIYVQDDDVIVSDPQAIVDMWNAEWCGGIETKWDGVVCNLPSEFRPHYPDSAMVGFGAAFHRDAPERAFARFLGHHRNMRRTDTVFQRESCRIFTTLTPRILVDVPKTDMPYASDPNRLWKDSKHVWYRGEALRLAREVRDTRSQPIKEPQ